MIIAPSLESQVRETLRDRIVQGGLEPGENLIESRLSAELGVSRTPLRAALSALERDGLVRSRPNYGWSVAPLDPAEAAELYPVLYVLEDLALQTAGLPDRAKLARLRAMNARIRDASSPRAALGANLAWHETLISGCGSQFLLKELAGVRDRVLRYEHAYFRKTTGIGSSHAFHSRIQGALARGDLNEASRALRDHWLSDLEFVTSAPALAQQGAGTGRVLRTLVVP